MCGYRIIFIRESSLVILSFLSLAPKMIKFYGFKMFKHLLMICVVLFTTELLKLEQYKFYKCSALGW